MASNILVPRWKWTGLYYAPEATWGTAVETGFIHVRSMAPVHVWASSPVVPPPEGGMGSGQPLNNAGDYALGRPAAAFSSQHPVTSVLWRDMWPLFFNCTGYNTASGDETYFGPYAEAGTVAWTPTMYDSTKNAHATVVAINDATTNATSYERATSCALNSLKLTIPQNTPGDTSGILTMDLGWIGRSTERGTTFTMGTPTEDTGTQYHTKDVTCTLGTANPYTMSVLSADITFSNGAALDPSAASYALGLTYGAPHYSGTITTYFAHGAHSATWPQTAEALFTALGGPTYQYMTITVGTSTDMDMALPFVVTGMPTFGEVNGIVTLQWSFVDAFSSATYPYKVHVPDANVFRDIA